jgi:hypothetical protein
MDYVLQFCDDKFLTPYVYPSSWPETDVVRQFVSLFFIMTVGGSLVYLIPASLNYFLIFDHKLMKHKRFLPNQVGVANLDCCTLCPRADSHECRCRFRWRCKLPYRLCPSWPSQRWPCSLLSFKVSGNLRSCDPAGVHAEWHGCTHRLLQAL